MSRGLKHPPPGFDAVAAYDRRVSPSPTPTSVPSGELFLIDGNSLAYRAFFALPESIATSDGRPTNAIYGFASMMVKILIDFYPRAVVVAWDAGLSGREKTYAPYKAQRKSRPDLLKEQWPHLAPLAEAFGFANVRVEGWEADDVIATMARQAREQEIPVMIVTGDRDAYQLVGDGVRVMTTSRGVTDTKIYDRDGVIERYGVPPELVPDLIGLKGDTSDNIPGVPGIGEKTAAQLLQEFGSLEDGARQRRRDLGAEAEAEPDRARRRRAGLEGARDDAPRRRGRARPRRARWSASPTCRDCARSRPSSSCAQVIQRLEDEWERRVPDREAPEEIELERRRRARSPTSPTGRSRSRSPAVAGAATTASA